MVIVVWKIGVITAGNDKIICATIDEMIFGVVIGNSVSIGNSVAIV